MAIQSNKSIEETVKLEARLSAIEHLLSNIAASILVSSNKTQADVDAVVNVTLDAIRKQGVFGLDPAISDALTAEIEDAMAALYKLVNRHMTALLKGVWSDVACSALSKHKRLELLYEGYSRIVEVHAVGLTKSGKGIMRVWQVHGNSSIDERIGWKLMKLDEAISAHVIDEESEAPRKGYIHNDSALHTITCQI